MADRQMVWVLDWVGYDVRGGSARVFSTKDLAKAASRCERWVSDGDDGAEAEDVGTSLRDMRVVYPVFLDEPDA